MKRVTKLFLVAALAALLSPAVASSAPRMYIGFHDDADFRWNPKRAEMLGQARSTNATIVRTLVDLAEDGADPAGERGRSLRPGLQLSMTSTSSSATHSCGTSR